MPQIYKCLRIFEFVVNTQISTKMIRMITNNLWIWPNIRKYLNKILHEFNAQQTGITGSIEKLENWKTGKLEVRKWQTWLEWLEKLEGLEYWNDWKDFQYFQSSQYSQSIQIFWSFAWKYLQIVPIIMNIPTNIANTANGTNEFEYRQIWQIPQIFSRMLKYTNG